MSVWPKNCIVALVIVFISGAVVGAGITYILQTEPEHFMERRRSAEEQATHFTNFYDDLLDLDEKQHKDFQQVLIKWVEDLRAIMKPIRAQMTARHYQMLENVKPILSEKQYRKMKDYMDNRYRKRDAAPASRPAE